MSCEALVQVGGSEVTFRLIAGLTTVLLLWRELDGGRGGAGRMVSCCDVVFFSAS